MEPIINSQVPEFKVQAFQNGSFKTVSSEDTRANGPSFSSILPTLRSYVRPNWSTWLTSTANFRKWVSKYIP